MESPPLLWQKRTVEAPSLDGLRDAAHAALTADGLRVRSLSIGPGVSNQAMRIVVFDEIRERIDRWIP
ncbi:MAG TPA: hypothetical protein VF469_31650 [Kofleriaceae bacterium]